ncbi:hypothetical protein [Wolbachia endosymbiont of Brugia malayi]|uniref:hypothetical protein n=1 Tax=Wolbachia endosymbiont of Brugia malayi TaxID=80849 RepID=UPI0002F5E293
MANSLVEAKKRGVDIKIILDKSQHIQNIVLCTSYLKKEYQFGIDYKPEIAHNRILIMMTTRLLQGCPISVIQLKKEMLKNY